MTFEQLTKDVQCNLGLNQLPEFIHDKIGLPNYVDICGCATSIETLYGQDVSVRDIVGIAQSPFNTWLDFLRSDIQWDRDKFDVIFRLARSNPEYYESGGDKDGWSFTCVNGRYYTLNGHHRTAIVKLMAAAGTVNVVRNVTVDYINYNPELLELTAHVRAMFRGFGEIFIDGGPYERYFRFRPRFEFCLPLNAEVDSFRDLTRGKVFWIILRLLWLSCWTRVKPRTRFDPPDA